MHTYFRAHGLGNDYLVMEGSPAFWTPRRVARLCERHRGLGGDGLLLRLPSTVADARVVILNADGSRAEKSGNGLRIFVRALLEAGLIGTHCTIETDSGVVEARVQDRSASGVRIEVNMGRPDFRAAALPMLWPDEEAIRISLKLADREIVGSAVSMGNPHFVVFIGAHEDIDAYPLRRLGPQVENHHVFPKKVNTQCARVRSDDQVDVRIWERGVGYTESSGSSACAVVAVGQRLGLLSDDVAVHMPGGMLEVRRDDQGRLHQSGPVEMISTGTVAPDLMHELNTMVPNAAVP